MADTSITKQDLDAYRIYCMINGIEMEDVPVVEDNNNNNSENAPKKKKKSSNSSKSKETFKTSESKVPELPIFSKLRKSQELLVTFNEHDIKYKEQFWGVPTRTVTYQIELVTKTQVAKTISDMMNNNSETERQRANEGKTRYYKIVTYETAVSAVREIGYIKVENQNGKLNQKFKVKSKTLKENNVNPDKVKKNIQKLLPTLILKEE